MPGYLLLTGRDIMNGVIETRFGRKSLHVCKDGSAENTEWISIYEEAFPPDQRQDLDDLKQQLQVGSMELDETRDSDNNILCMTITEVFRQPPSLPTFLLACYTAVVPDMRGCGIGSIHRSRLDGLLASEYPDYIGIVSEIESTFESGLSAEALKIRVRRKAFFMKLGLQPLALDYYFPSYAKGAKPLPGELLWVPFNDTNMTSAMLAGVVTRIYTEGYRLNEGDPLIGKVLDSIEN